MYYFLEKADEGELKIGDTKINLKKASRKEILNVRRRTAFVFQNYGLFHHKTALENAVRGIVLVTTYFMRYKMNIRKRIGD